MLVTRKKHVIRCRSEACWCFLTVSRQQAIGYIRFWLRRKYLLVGSPLFILPFYGICLQNITRRAHGELFNVEQTDFTVWVKRKWNSHCLESGVTFSIRAMKLSRNSVLLLDSSRSLQYSLRRRRSVLIQREGKNRARYSYSASLAPHRWTHNGDEDAQTHTHITWCYCVPHAHGKALMCYSGVSQNKRWTCTAIPSIL